MNVQQTTIFDFLGVVEETPKTITVVNITTEKTSPKKEENKNLTDFGEKIGYARKDLWHDRYLSFSDIAKMSEKEKRKYVTKNNVFPSPKWKELEEKQGYDKIVLFGKKRVRDSLPTVPAYDVYDTDKADEYFIELVSGIRDVLNGVEEYEDFTKLNTWLVDNGFVKSMCVTSKGAMLNINKVHSAIQEVQPRNKNYFVHKMHNSNFLGAPKKVSKPRKKKLMIEELKTLREDGFDYIDRDVTTDDILSLGFRGGEFGNWTNQSERQQHLNMTYDAINNIATVLGVTPQQFLYPSACRSEDIDCNALAIGFGSRGQSSALAHYEPLLHVINLTRMKGAGSLGHELGHAFDHMMREGIINQEYKKTNYAFQSYNNKSVFNNENVRLALEILWKTIHKKQLTPEEAVAKHNSQKAEVIQEIRDVFEKNVKKTACQNLDDEQQFDDILSEYIYEISMVDDFYWKCDDTITAKLAQKPMFFIANSHQYKRWLKAKRTSISTETRILKDIAVNGTKEVVDTKFFDDACIIDTNYSKMGHGYWNSDVELFARAWACYLKDKLLEKGIVDDYLVGHADTAPVINPITKELVFTSPQGKERENINKAFDNLIKTLKDENFF